MNEFAVLCDQLKKEYSSEGLLYQYCLELASRLEASCCFFQGLISIIRQPSHQHNSGEQTSISVDGLVAWLCECHDICCEKLLQTDIPLYRTVLEEHLDTKGDSISAQQFQDAVVRAIEVSTQQLNSSFSELMKSKLGTLNEIDSMHCFLDDVVEACSTGRLALCRRYFDQVLVRHSGWETIIRSQEDFFDFLLSLKLQEEDRQTLISKIQEFYEVLESERLTPQCVESGKSHPTIISRKASLDTLVMRRYEDDLKELETELQDKNEQIHELKMAITDLDEDSKRLFEYNKLLREGICCVRDQNKYLWGRLRIYELDCYKQQVGFDEERTQLNSDLRELQVKYRDLAENLRSCQETSYEFQRIIEQSKMQPDFESRQSKSPSALDLESKPLSKHSSYRGNLCEEVGGDSVYDYCATPPVEREVVDGQAYWESAPTSNFRRGESVIRDLEQLLMKSKKGSDMARVEPSEPFVYPIIVLTEYELHNTKLLSLGVLHVDVYNQDKTQFASLAYSDITEVVLVDCNPSWLVLRTAAKEYLIYMRRRYYLASELERYTTIRVAPASYIQLIYHSQNKKLTDLPRELYNPMRFITLGSVHSGHIFFKENRRLSSQELLQYYCVLTRSAILLFDSLCNSILRVVPIMDSSELTQTSSPTDLIEVWKLTNKLFSAGSYSLGFETPRLAACWSHHVLNCISLLRQQSSYEREAYHQRFVMHTAGS